MPRFSAIDIGSNSVRMMVAEMTPGAPPQVLASDRAITRLGESVFRTGRISEEAITFVCECLKRMSDTAQRLEPLAVRAVATAAVRDTNNQEEFMTRASEAAGVPVEIISGQEEARLIHLGVESHWPHPQHRILIVDVGGGSAELISGDKGELEFATSRPLGAVRLNEVFLSADPPKPHELHRMEQFIDEKLASDVKQLEGRPYDRVIGTSATAAALVCAVNRIPRARRDEADQLRATTQQLRKLYNDLTERPLAERRKMTGIGPRRAEIIVPGAAVFLRVLQSLDLPALYYSVAGVRDGILADLANRGVGAEKTRLTPEQRRVVEDVARKYGVPIRHAERVASLAQSLFAQLQGLHRLPPPAGRLLEAAAFLHNVGHFISATGHHKHSLYVVSNSDLPGFTDRERNIIAVLCRHHRKTMPQPRHEAFQSLSPEARNTVMHLIPLLRIAIALDQRHEQHVTEVDCHLREDAVLLALHAKDDADMEQWAAERVRNVFEQVYAKPLHVTRARSNE